MLPIARRALAGAAVLFLVGCDDDSPKEITDVREEPATTDFRPTSTADRLGFTAGPGHAHGSNPHEGMEPGATGGFQWTTPEGFEEKNPPGQMREVDFRLKRDPSVECYLSVTQGGIAQNVVRWYQQMEKEPIAQSAVAELPTAPFLGQKGRLVDLEGTFVGMRRSEPKPGYRMLGLVVEEPGRTVTLKMTGPAAVVAEERERFLALAASFRTGAPAAEPERDASLAWDAPPEWELRKGHSIRLVTFAPKGSEGVECWVTVLQGSGGGIEPNLQLWRQQMGQPALSAAEVAALETVRILDTDAKFIAITGDYTDMQGKKAAQAGMMLGAVCQLPGALLTVKMTGPLEAVEKEKDRFLAFCRSLRTP